MAEGGVDFGDERAPLLDHTDEQDDGDEAAGGNETTGFEPGASSTPAPRQTTMNRPGEPSFDLPNPPGHSTTTFAETELLKEFPEFDKNKIKYKLDEKNNRLKAGIIYPKKPYFFLTTEIPGKKGQYQIKSLTREVLNALGKSRRGTLEEEIKRLTVGINDNKAMAEDSNLSETKRNKARERAKKQIEKRTDLARQLDQLKKGNYSLPNQSN